MKVQQLLRNSVEPFEPQSANVSSLEELLELPWIKRVAQYNGKFYRFSCSGMGDDGLLMANLHGTWQVMATLSGDDAKDIINSLPIWTLSKSRST
jgi:hypothetical protein